MSEGDAFNTALLRRSRQRIENLDISRRSSSSTLPGSSPDKTRIEVEVSEQSTGELSFGAGYSTSDGPLGDIRLSERNFLGRGQSIQANFTISARTQEIDFGSTEPYFLDREVAAGFDLFRRSTNFQSEGSFDQRTTGGTLRATYPLTERWQHGVRLTLREDAIKDVDDNASQFIKDEQGTRHLLLGQSLPTIPATRASAHRGLYPGAGSGCRGLRRRHAVRPRRGPGIVLHPPRPAGCSTSPAAAATSSAWVKTSACSTASWAAPRFRASSSQASGRVTRRPGTLGGKFVYRYHRATLSLGAARRAQDLRKSVRRGRQPVRSGREWPNSVRQQRDPGVGRRRPLMAFALARSPSTWRTLQGG